MKTTIYEEVTSRVLAALEKGPRPWRNPLGRPRRVGQPRPALNLPLNARSRKPYQGINIMLLWLQDRGTPYWGTEKTWEGMGAAVLPGESPTEIFLCIFSDRNGKRVPFLRSYEVYNLSQVRGCDSLRQTPEAPADLGAVDRLVKNTCAKVIDSEAAAWYDVRSDVIHCPARARFRTAIGYSTTRLHELGHWTGHPSRLKRVFGANRETREYAFEELVAELTSCFTAASLAIPEALEEMPNHASYLAEWLAILKEDERAVFRAASQSQKATTYLLAFKSDKE